MNFGWFFHLLHGFHLLLPTIAKNKHIHKEIRQSNTTKNKIFTALSAWFIVLHFGHWQMKTTNGLRLSMLCKGEYSSYSRNYPIILGIHGLNSYYRRRLFRSSLFSAGKLVNCWTSCSVLGWRRLFRFILLKQLLNGWWSWIKWSRQSTRF